ncbi:MAG: MFS transporter [Candidatus Kapabacteria bacterium]|nr:MFS transporter [Candidatus Kapabacteria bacterium]
MNLPFVTAEFLAFLQLRFFMAVAWHMQALVVSWYVYDLTRDPLWLALVGLAEAIPAIGMAMPMGYVVDRLDKRRGIRVAVLMFLASALGTATLLQPTTLQTIGIGAVLNGLLAMIVINGAGRIVYSPSMFSSLGRIVEREHIPRASAFNSAVWQAAMVTGPVVGGLLYGFYGIEVASMTILGLMAIGGIGALRITPKPPVKHESQGSMREDLTLGIRFIFSRPVILGALSLDLFAVLFGGVVALLPVFAKDILKTDEAGLGLLRAAMGLGSIITMVLVAWRPIGRNAGRRLLWSVAGFGISILCFAVSTSFWLSMALLVLAGGFDAVSVVIRHTILQLQTPEEMKGRVAAANTMFISSSNELGAVESGIAARLFGTVPSVLIGGTVTLAVVAVVAITNKALRHATIHSEPDRHQ